MENGANLEQLTREIAETRSELDHTLDALGESLSPHHVKERAVGYVKEQARELGTNVTAAVQQNALPLAAIGVSIAGAAVLYGRHRAAARRSDESTFWHQLADAMSGDGIDLGAEADAAREAAGEALHSIGHGVRGLAGRAKPALHQASGRVEPVVHQVAERMEPVISEVASNLRPVVQRTLARAQDVLRGGDVTAPRAAAYLLCAGIGIAIGVFAGARYQRRVERRRRFA